EQRCRPQIDLDRAPDAHRLTVGAQEQRVPAVALHDRRRVLERRRLGERIDPPHVEIERSGRAPVPVIDADRRRLRRRAGEVGSGVPQRASRRPSLSKTLTRPCLGSWVTPWRREVWPLCHQSSETYARPCSSKTMWVGRCVSPHSERYSPSGLKIWMRSLSRS